MTLYKESAREVKVRRFFEANTLQQFGQPADDWVWDGKTGCTHTCWQKLAKLWKGLRLTLNAVNAHAGMPHNATANGQPRGMRIAESQHLVRDLGLPYVLKLDLTVDQLRFYAQRGPVLYGMRYGSAPDWRGYRYNGVVADGKPNGYALKHGRTQLTGAENIRHAAVLLFDRVVQTDAGRYLRTEVLRWEPNHGSPSRPERPPYDIISVAQLSREYADYNAQQFAFVPTRSLPV